MLNDGPKNSSQTVSPSCTGNCEKTISNDLSSTPLFQKYVSKDFLDKGDINHQEVSKLLNRIRINNINRGIIGHLNVNFFAIKLDYIRVIITENVDIMIFTEAKLDASYPYAQLKIDGFKKPYRLDRNTNGGGVMIYVREDIPSDRLNKHNTPTNVEAIFVEINLRKNKLLLVGMYHSTNAEYGTSDAVFFEQIRFALDVYSNYDKFLLAGDFNLQEGEDLLDDFMDEFHSKNLVKETTCFKNPENPSCIDLFITNSHGSFQKTSTVSTGLSDFHKMVVIVLKTTFPKAKPKVIPYRDFSKYKMKMILKMI